MNLIISLFIFSSLLLIGMMQPQTQVYNWKEVHSFNNENSYMNDKSDRINYATPFITNSPGWLPIGINSNLFATTFNETISDLYKKNKNMNEVSLFGSTDSSKADSKRVVHAIIVRENGVR